jgi:hypothetical protein
MPGSDHIGCSQQVPEAREMTFKIATGSLTDQNGFGTVLVPDLLEFSSDGIQRLVPGNTLPTTLILFHGMQNPVRVVGQLGNSQSL